jgi:hypothetical protein
MRCSVPPESLPPDDAPTFAIPWSHAVHHATTAMPCGCRRRTVHAGEIYVTIGSYNRVNCWGCLVYYGWATLDDVPEPLRTEIAHAQHRP